MRLFDKKGTVVFDFDGVIHSYTSGWQGEGVANDPIVPGMAEELKRIYTDGYKVVVVSTRCNSRKGMDCVNDYLLNNGVLKYVDLITAKKPPAICYIDDRAICFDGHPEGLLEKIQNFKPWNK